MGGRSLILTAALALCGHGCGSDDSTRDGDIDARRNDGAAPDASIDGTAVADAGGLDSGLDVVISRDAAADADDAPTPLPTPIRYLVIMTKENHTFDNLFYDFPGVASPAPATARTSTGATINLARSILPFTVLHKIGSSSITADPVHSHFQARDSYHGGHMDRFDQPDHSEVGNLPFYHYPEEQIRNYWTYARNFVLADNFFTSGLSPSGPGHIAVIAGYSPMYDNENCPNSSCPSDPCESDSPLRTTVFNDRTCAIGSSNARACFDIPSVVDRLPDGITWRTYDINNTPLRYIKSIHDSHALATHGRAGAALLSDLQRGDMANLTLLNGGFGGPSEHPPQHPCNGENYTVQIINAIMASGHWNETAIIVAYDDWGGWYDHVVPTVTACQNATNGPFNTGFRVPLILISPFARRGATGSGLVFHDRTEQASLSRLVAEIFRAPDQPAEFMQSRNAQSRDGDAASLLPAFDFTQSPRAPMMLTPRTDCPALP